MLKMNLKCTRCKAGWVAEGMPEEFYRDALNEFLTAHKECAPESSGTDYVAALVDLKRWIDLYTFRDHAGIELTRIYDRLNAGSAHMDVTKESAA